MLRKFFRVKTIDLIMEEANSKGGLKRALGPISLKLL